VVDDEETVRDLLVDFLTQKGYSVITAKDGEEALHVIQREHPYLILLDIRMPRLDGLNVLRLIRKVNKEAHVVMMTAVEDEEVAKEAKKLGAYDYITKPFNLGYVDRVVWYLTFVKKPKQSFWRLFRRREDRKSNA
jgi:DNA-binding response OmpR family regulator